MARAQNWARRGLGEETKQDRKQRSQMERWRSHRAGSDGRVRGERGEGGDFNGESYREEGE